MTDNNAKFEIEINKSYRNRQGGIVQIVSLIPEGVGVDYTVFGFRFTDNFGMSYRPDGSHQHLRKESDFDLIEEVPEEALINNSYSIGSSSLSDKHLGGDPRITAVLQTMMDFHVLSGRVTRFQAEQIVKKLDSLPKKKEETFILPELGKSYLTAHNEVVKMTMLVEPPETAYDRGYRFVSNMGIYYNAKGWTNPYPCGGQDLVKEVENTVSNQLDRNRAGIIDELGYYAAMGRVISAVKLYRSIFGGGLIQAKDAIMEAKASAERRYKIPLVGGERRIEDLEECLKVTRRLVARCAANGFRNDDLVSKLFINNQAICRLVPITVAERQSITEDLAAVEELDKK